MLPKELQDHVTTWNLMAYLSYVRNYPGNMFLEKQQQQKKEKAHILEGQNSIQGMVNVKSSFNV